MENLVIEENIFKYSTLLSELLDKTKRNQFLPQGFFLTQKCGEECCNVSFITFIAVHEYPDSEALL